MARLFHAQTLMNWSGVRHSCTILALANTLGSHFMNRDAWAQQGATPQASATSKSASPQRSTREGQESKGVSQMAVQDTSDRATRSQASRLPVRDTVVVVMQKSSGRDWSPLIIALVSVAATVIVTWLTNRQRAGEFKQTLQQRGEELTKTLDQKNDELTKTLAQKQVELDRTLAIKQAELDRTLGSQAREEEAAELRKRLTTFYGPLKQQMELARVLHERLLQGDPKRTRENFRTLITLLTDDTLTPNDKAIVEELVATTSSIRTLIMKAEGVVEDIELLRVLSTAAAHFRILDLAAAGKIRGEVSRFESSTYPRELDGMVDAEIARIRLRLQILAQV